MTILYKTKYSQIEYSKTYGTLWITRFSTDETIAIYLEPNELKEFCEKVLTELKEG